MACRKNLLTVGYHYDDETGMYRVGEIDTGINGDLPEYIERYGTKGAHEILAGLAYLSGQVMEELRCDHRLANQPRKDFERLNADE